MRPTSRLRQLLMLDTPLILPGVYDALSAHIATQAGAQALYLSGSSVAASLLGKPDVGLTTLTEMTDVARRIVMAADLPVVADADTGYGNALNVMHTIRSYEAAGLAGMHIEDQVSPKKCGHFAGKELIPAAEMVGKIRAALDARRDPEFFIIARTDARSVTGLDDAIARASAYAEAGADAIFVEAPHSREEYASIARALPDVALVADVTEGGRSPALAAEDYYALGFRLVLFSASALRATMKTLDRLYRRVMTEHTTSTSLDLILEFDERNRILGLESVYETERKYAAPPGGPAPAGQTMPKPIQSHKEGGKR